MWRTYRRAGADDGDRSGVRLVGWHWWLCPHSTPRRGFSVFCSFTARSAKWWSPTTYVLVEVRSVDGTAELPAMWQR